MGKKAEGNNTPQEQGFVNAILALNGNMGAKWLFEQVRKIVPSATYIDMGYDGGYSPRIEKGRLMDYDGSEYTGKLDIVEFINDRNGEFALGVTKILTDIEGEQSVLQIYHNGRTWAIETHEGEHKGGKDAREILERFKEIAPALV